MYRNFDKRTATIYLTKGNIKIPKRDGTFENTDGIIISIVSDFGNKGFHKSQLSINEKLFSVDVKNVWDSVKDTSNKIVELSVYFDEIDYYDNMTNVYTTPIVSIKKGQRIVHIEEKEHGSIPKDWEITLTAKFENLQRIAPIITLIEKVLGPNFTTAIKNDFEKATRELLQGKVNNLTFNLSNE